MRCEGVRCEGVRGVVEGVGINCTDPDLVEVSVLIMHTDWFSISGSINS